VITEEISAARLYFMNTLNIEKFCCVDMACLNLNAIQYRLFVARSPLRIIIRSFPYSVSLATLAVRITGILDFAHRPEF
jgi:hypothetical protein